ncbi:MAG: adenosylcobinamide amidohydrolase [Halanaeroarchaeum sp.]
MGEPPAIETAVREGVVQVRRPGTRWLATGWDGGYDRADAAYNVSVPDGWERRDLAAYVEERRERAGFDASGPAMLTGVDMDHLVGARLGDVVAYATVGLTNPASLPQSPSGDAAGQTGSPPAGTVNLLVVTDRALGDGALATLLGTVVEAKAATLQARTGFTGTTSDAVAVGSDPDGAAAAFAGSATAIGAAARACVREAIGAGLAARPESTPDSVDEAEHGVRTERRASVFDP